MIDWNEPFLRASAPGRVNLMGDHTDYNDGFVLPMPLPYRTQVALTPRPQARIIRVSSAALGAGSYILGEEQRQSSWLDYVQGVTYVLRARGASIGGFEAQIESDVPIGAGLSSSAALEVALLRALRSAFDLQLDDLQLAILGRAVETDFIGVPIGLMDQLAASLGEAGQALFIDMRSLKTLPVAIPQSLEVVVIDSGMTHAHDSNGYRIRREQCTLAAECLGLRSLRDCGDEHAPMIAQLDPVLQRRVRHVLSENARVLATVRALQQQDASELGRLFSESQRSLRDDYEVSHPAVDRLIELASGCPGIVAARMTGGGFGGAIVLLAERGRGSAAARETVARARSEQIGQASVLLPKDEEAAAC
jgi:galactokinase